MDMPQTLEDFQPIANFKYAIPNLERQIQAITRPSLKQVDEPAFPKGTRVFVSGCRDSDPRKERIVIETGKIPGRDGIWCLLRDPLGIEDESIDRQCFLRRVTPERPARQVEVVSDERRAAYREALLTMDWAYNRSEDQRVYSKYRDQSLRIHLEQPIVDPEFVIWNACVPRVMRKTAAVVA